MRKHYVEFWYPGLLVSDSSSRPVASRNEKIELPGNAYAYRFYDREEIDQGGETLRGIPKDYSGHFFRHGTIKTLADVEAEPNPSQSLLSNMRGNKIDRVIDVPRKGTYPFTEKDQMLPK